MFDELDRQSDQALGPMLADQQEGLQGSGAAPGVALSPWRGSLPTLEEITAPEITPQNLATLRAAIAFVTWLEERRIGVNDEEYKKRQRVAMLKLRKLGLYRAAQEWLQRGHHDPDWYGTPLEYALEEMPRWRILRWIGL